MCSRLEELNKQPMETICPDCGVFVKLEIVQMGEFKAYKGKCGKCGKEIRQPIDW